MLKWFAHSAFVILGVTAFLNADMNSPSILRGAIFPLLMGISAIYFIVVVVVSFFGWSGPSDRGADGSSSLSGLGNPSDAAGSENRGSGNDGSHDG